MDIYHQHLEIQVLNMKLFVARLMMLLILTAMVASCSSLNIGSAVKAGFDSEEESWLAKKIPGVKTLSNMIPPPTEARLKWDQYNNNKQKDASKSDEF
jgi:uncharacterized protein YunC (DUF1805 family)